MENFDWKFWIGDIGVPIITFIIGLFAGKVTERKAKAKVKGNNNTITQNSKVDCNRRTGE